MAQVAGTYRTNDMVGIKEDISDVIYNISPKETPFMSAIGREKATQTLTEWQTDALAAVDSSNKQVEGDDASFATVAPTTRLSNYTQISRKAIIVSGTAQAVDSAGRADEFEYQAAKRAAELKRDMEAILCSEQDSSAGTVTVARKLGGFESWITSNASRGLGASSGGYANGRTSSPQDASATATRSFTESLLKAVMQSAWSAGGQPSMAIMGPSVKQQASAFSGIATQYRENSGVKQATILAAASVYVSDFGEIKLVPSRFSRSRSVLLVDPEFWAVSYLRPFKTEKLAKTGDAQKALMTVEYTLISKNEGSSGVIADLKG